MGADLERPWERQGFDTDKEWTWFQEYLALVAPRNLVILARRAGCPWSWGQLQQVASDGGWDLRAKAWDDHLDQLRVETIEATIKETAADVAERHSKVWARQFRIIARELEKLDQQSKDSRFTTVLQPRDLFRGLDLTVKAERLAMGEATARVDQGPDLSTWPEADVNALRELMARNSPR